MQKIIPYLWFDNQAEEAVNFYVAAFGEAEVGSVSRYEEENAEVSGRPAESVMTVEFRLKGRDFVALNGGPYFKFSPATSFFVNCSTRDEVDRLWEKLAEGGSVLMGLDKYPFSERYGWIQDKYGVSWQLNLAPREQKIAVCLMFVGRQCGKSEEAMHMYTSLFKDSAIKEIARYDAGDYDKEGLIKHAVFTLEDEEFMAMDSSLEHLFTFTPAISLLVNCRTQEEVDKLWEKFSDGGEIEQCGWLKDRFGVSWQIVPTVLGKLLSDPDPVKSRQVMKAMLQMKKLDIKGLTEAYEQ